MYSELAPIIELHAFTELIGAIPTLFLQLLFKLWLELFEFYFQVI